jgi:hypothetical protein
LPSISPAWIPPCIRTTPRCFCFALADRMSRPPMRRAPSSVVPRAIDRSPGTVLASAMSLGTSGTAAPLLRNDPSACRQSVRRASSSGRAAWAQTQCSKRSRVPLLRARRKRPENINQTCSNPLRCRTDTWQQDQSRPCRSVAQAIAGGLPPSCALEGFTLRGRAFIALTADATVEARRHCSPTAWTGMRSSRSRRPRLRAHVQG